MTPRGTLKVEEVHEMIAAELEHARSRFGPMASPHEGIAVVREEYVELEKEVFGDGGRRTAALAEAVQLAAMAARYVLDLAGDDGPWLLARVRSTGTVRSPRQ